MAGIMGKYGQRCNLSVFECFLTERNCINAIRDYTNYQRQRRLCSLLLFMCKMY